MKPQLHLYTLALTLTLTSVISFAHTRVALLDFSTDDNSIRSLNAGANASAAIQPQLGDIADVVWVERTEMSALRQEININQSGLVEADAIRLGRMVKADIMIQGRFILTKTGRQLRIEAIDLFHADVLATRTIACPGSIVDPVELTPDFIANATQASRETINESLAILHKSSSRRTIGGLFIRNISDTDRLDYLSDNILDKLSTSVKSTDDLRWLNFSRASETYEETQLALLGLTSPDPSAWRSPADLFLWGSIEEKQDYSGPADKVPFTVTITIWDGSGTLHELKVATTPIDSDHDIDSLLADIVQFIRKAKPRNLAETRATISEEIFRRSREVRTSYTVAAGQPLGAAARARTRYSCQLLDLALFLSPDNQKLRFEALNSRQFYTQNTPSHYATQLMLFQRCLDYIEQYKYRGPNNTDEFFVWSILCSLTRDIFWIHSHNISISGMPYDLTKADQRKLEDRLLHRFRRAFELMLASNPQNIQFCLGMISLNFLAVVANSNASPEVRLDFIEFVWPHIATPVQTSMTVMTSDVQSLRTSLSDLYNTLGRPDRSAQMFASADADSQPRVITINVPPDRSELRPGGPREPFRPRIPVRPDIALRLGVNPDVKLRSETDSKPIAGIPLLPSISELHNISSPYPMDQRTDPTIDFRLRSIVQLPGYPNTYQPSPFPFGSRSGLCQPIGRGPSSIWFQSEGAPGTANRPIVYNPVTQQMTTLVFSKAINTIKDPNATTQKATVDSNRPQPAELLNIVGACTWQNRMLAISSTDGLYIIDSDPSSCRLLGGQQGLATTSLEAIVSDSDTILISGADKRRKSRIIRFDPTTETFEDLILNIPANRKLWLSGQQFVYLDSDGYIWRNLKTGFQTRVSDAIALAGITIGDPKELSTIRIVGVNQKELWVLFKNQLIGISEDRKKILARLSMSEAQPLAMTLSEDGQYAFLVVNPWTFKESSRVPNIEGSYLLIADLVQHQWAGQYSLPLQPTSMLAAFGRIWFTFKTTDPMFVLNRTDLKLRPGENIPIKPQSSQADQLRYSAYNGDADSVRAILNRRSYLLSEFNQDGRTLCEQLFRNAPESILQILLEKSGSGNQNIPQSAIFSAIRRNMSEIAVKLTANGDSLTFSDPNSSRTPLRLAAIFGNEPLVRSLIARGALDNDSTDSLGESALACAICFHRTSVVKTLLESKKPILDKYYANYSPVHLAILVNDLDILNLLLSAGADTNVWTKQTVIGNKKMTPLMLAVRNRQLKMIESLIAKNADPNLADSQGESPLIYATMQNDEEIIALLKAKGAVPALPSPKVLRSRITLAIQSRNTDELKSLLDGGADPNLPDARGLTPICEAAAFGSIEAVMELLRHKANTEPLYTPESTIGPDLVSENTYRNIAIARAKIVGAATTQVSIPANLQKNRNQPTNLQEAIDRGESQSAIAFLALQKQLPPLPAEQWPLLHRAVSRNMPDVVSAMLRLFGDADSRGLENTTPLMIAAADGNADMVRLLLNAGALVHLRNSGNLTAADLARSHNYIKIAEMIDPPSGQMTRAAIVAIDARHKKLLRFYLDQGLSPDSTDVNGQSLLMIAVRSRFTDGVTMLLDNKAKVDQQDRQGRTALHWLILNRSADQRTQILSQLIKAGASPDLPDQNGATPKTLAAQLLGSDNKLFNRSQ